MFLPQQEEVELELLLKVKCSSEGAASQKAVERVLIDHGIKMVRPKKAEFFDHYGIVNTASRAEAYNLAKKLEKESMGRFLRLACTQ